MFNEQLTATAASSRLTTREIYLIPRRALHLKQFQTPRERENECMGMDCRYPSLKGKSERVKEG